MSAGTLRTPLCDRLGIEVPIVQAPIGSASTPELVAAVAEAGALGMLALTWVSVDEAIWRVRRVREIDEVLVRQFGAQRLKDAQAADAAIEDADRGPGVQAAATGMFLNSPVAMRFCHSAGPVMCALVPPASTATVTGMSTTSNS